MQPLAFIRRRFQAWWQSRLPLTDQLTLTQRNVYIVPTGPGWMLAATLLTLLVAAINYQLSLGYLLTFLLGGCALVGMHVGHATLRGLAMNLLVTDAQQAGSAALIDIQLTNTRRAARYGIGLSVLRPHDVDAAAQKAARKTSHWSWTDVPAQGSSTVQVAFTPTRRGLQRLPTLTAETRFPLGTFRVWTVWRPAAQVLVYPAPELHPPPLPPGEPRPSNAAAASRAQNSAEFDGLRSYQRGDAMKRVVWKKAAKADELVSRDTQQSQRFELWLDLAQAVQGLGNSKEHALSRLCAWVLLAEKQGLRYGLRLPGTELPPDSGPAHQKNCLQALALA